MTWMGQDLTAITDAVSSAQSQTLTYSATNRLASAAGAYGTFAWTYDGVGNRTSETLGSVVSTYAYPSSSNRLTSITPGTGTPRSFGYDAAGDTLTDSRTGALGLGFAYDVEHRLAVAQQTNNTANTTYYISDAQDRLSTRNVTQSTAPTSTTTNYFYDLRGHLIAEMNPTGTQTLREYLWLDDVPVAVVDWVTNASPTVYYVHVDHLSRPIEMTDGSGNVVWSATYSPFGATTSITQNPEVMNARFPGQWFQLETGLSYNWHRHYDATTGRYMQPDPLTVDDGNPIVSGLAADVLPAGGSDGHATARRMGWKEAHDIIMKGPSSRAMLQDGPSVYGYAKQQPLILSDKLGLTTPTSGASWGMVQVGQNRWRFFGENGCADSTLNFRVITRLAQHGMLGKMESEVKNNPSEG